MDTGGYRGQRGHYRWIQETLCRVPCPGHPAPAPGCGHLWVRGTWHVVKIPELATNLFLIPHYVSGQNKLNCVIFKLNVGNSAVKL